MTKCKTCGVRTSASAGYCQRCKSLRHHGYKRLKEEGLLLDEAGGAWWVWNQRGDVLVTGEPTRDAAILALGGGVDDVDDDGSHHATIRYLKITLVDGTRFLLRVTRESPHLLTGYEVNAEGEEVVPPGYDRRQRHVGRGLIKKAVEMRMSSKYATLEPVPAAHARVRKPSAQLDADIAEVVGRRAKKTDPHKLTIEGSGRSTMGRCACGEVLSGLGRGTERQQVRAQHDKHLANMAWKASFPQ